MVARPIGYPRLPSVTASRQATQSRNGQEDFALQKANFEKAMKKGVKIALGTDAGGFDWKKLSEAEEFVYYVQNGMTPMQAIRAGTSSPRSCSAGAKRPVRSKPANGRTSSP